MLYSIYCWSCCSVSKSTRPKHFNRKLGRQWQLSRLRLNCWGSEANSTYGISRLILTSFAFFSWHFCFRFFGSFCYKFSVTVPEFSVSLMQFQAPCVYRAQNVTGSRPAQANQTRSDTQTTWWRTVATSTYDTALQNEQTHISVSHAHRRNYWVGGGRRDADSAKGVDRACTTWAD